jgi:hypothetical protein
VIKNNEKTVLIVTLIISICSVVYGKNTSEELSLAKLSNSENKQTDSALVDYGPVIYISCPSTNAIYYTSFIDRDNQFCTWATLTNRIELFYGFSTNVAYLTEIKATGATPVSKVTELIDLLSNQYNQEYYILFNNLKCYQSPMLIKRMEEEIKFDGKQKTNVMWYY